MTNGARRLLRERKMRALVKRWEESGLSVARFAECEGIDRKTLYRWRDRAGTVGGPMRRGVRAPRANAAAPTARGTTPATAMFTEVNASLRGSTGADIAFEIVLRGGERVRVPPGFEAAALGRLLAVLRPC